MNEQSKIQEQIAALETTRLALMKNDSEDIDSYRQLAGMVSDLQYRLLAQVSNPQPERLGPDEVEALQAAQKCLDDAVKSAQGATHILWAATALAKL